MFRLFIYINGIKEIFETNQNETIRDLKSKIEESFGIDPDFQRLEYHSSILDDDKTLNDYKICEESVIYFYFYRRNDILRLLFRILDGTKVRLKTNANEKIRGLKLKLQEKSNINVDDKELVFQGVILKDDKTVIEYNIYNNSIILLISRPKLVKIWIQPIKCDKFIIEINTIETIRDLKMKIQEKFKFDLDMDKPKLIFRASVLDDDETVEQCGICDEDVINLIILRQSFLISVKSDEGKTITMETHRNETIRDLKIKIHQRFGFDPNDHRVLFQSCLSDNDKTVSKCGVVENCVININIRPEPDMEIYVKSSTHNYRIPINRNETVRDLKMIIYKKSGIHPKYYRLQFGPVYLVDDARTLDQCGIRDRDIINLVNDILGGGHQFWKPWGGKSFQIYDIESGNWTFRDLKMKIQAKLGIYPDDQILCHEGSSLDDSVDSLSRIDEIDLDIGANVGKYLVVQLVQYEIFFGIHLRNGTIRDLKKEIQEELGIHPDNQILSAAGAILRDKQILNDYPMNEKRIVALDIRRNEQSQIRHSLMRENHGTAAYHNEIN